MFYVRMALLDKMQNSFVILLKHFHGETVLTSFMVLEHDTDKFTDMIFRIPLNNRGTLRASIRNGDSLM